MKLQVQVQLIIVLQFLTRNQPIIRCSDLPQPIIRCDLLALLFRFFLFRFLCKPKIQSCLMPPSVTGVVVSPCGKVDFYIRVHFLGSGYLRVHFLESGYLRVHFLLFRGYIYIRVFFRSYASILLLIDCWSWKFQACDNIPKCESKALLWLLKTFLNFSNSHPLPACLYAIM